VDWAKGRLREKQASCKVDRQFSPGGSGDGYFVINNGRKMEILNTIEAQILSTLQTLYNAWGWFGVAAMLIFENATGITPSEIILGLAGWMLIAEHQQPVTMAFAGGSVDHLLGGPAGRPSVGG
jgi:hypothetical protein